MAEQRWRGTPPCARHAGHLDQQAEEDEQRHGSRMSALIPSSMRADHDRERRRGGERAGRPTVASAEGEARSARRSARRRRAAATKKISRFKLPSAMSAGCREPEPRPTTPTTTAATSDGLGAAEPQQTQHASTSISAAPTGMPRRATMFGQPSAGVSMNALVARRSRSAGQQDRAGTAHGAGDAPARRRSACAARRAAAPTTAVSRMCSPRRSASTAPSMASQRNRIEASSSDQTSGR